MEVIETPLFSSPYVDLATDEKTVLLGGVLENGTAFRIPMSVESAMQILELLIALQQDKELPLSSTPVEIDLIQ